jgi:hypothetical protein
MGVERIRDAWEDVWDTGGPARRVLGRLREISLDQGSPARPGSAAAKISLYIGDYLYT